MVDLDFDPDTTGTPPPSLAAFVTVTPTQAAHAWGVTRATASKRLASGWGRRLGGGRWRVMIAHLRAEVLRG